MKLELHQKTIQDYDQIAPYFSQTRQFLWPEFKLFEKHLKPDLTILDLGCGNGRLSKLIIKKGCQYIGIDNSKGQIKEAQKQFPDQKFILGDLTKIPLEDESIDQIWCIAAFHHLPDKPSRTKALQEMKRVLKKDGLIVMTNWNLFQKKYQKFILKSVWNFIKTFGEKYAWNDTFIPWKNGNKKIVDRYYHAFLPCELEKLFPQNSLQIINKFYCKKGQKVSFLKSHNICHILKK